MGEPVCEEGQKKVLKKKKKKSTEDGTEAPKEVKKKKKKKKKPTTTDEGATDVAAPKKKKKKKQAETEVAEEETKPKKKKAKAGDSEEKPKKKKKKKVVVEEEVKEEMSAVDSKLLAIREKIKAAASNTSARNPSGCTRLFVGNLPWTIEDAGLAELLGVEKLEAVKYLTDKDTKKFYGTAFVEVCDVDSAANAVARTGCVCQGRAIKISYSPPKPGDVWPPVKQASRAGKERERTPRPTEGATRLFIGNVAYEADDDNVRAVFTEVVPNGLKALRWLTHKDTGEFRGCGFIDFYTEECADAAVALDGKTLKGRPIRLDYSG